MSVSSPFIHRPIATSLLGIAVMLGGMLGYLWLPVSSLPQVDFPTIQVTTQLPGAQPRHHGVAGDGAARAQVRPDSVAAADDLVELVRDQPDHAAVRPQPRHRRRRAGRAGRHQRRRLDAAAQPALSADLFEGEPGRRADRDAGADLPDHLAAPAQRPRRHAADAAAERGDRRRPRLGAGRHQAGRAHPGRSGPARQLRHRARGPAHRHRRAPTSPARRARSTARTSPTPSPPTTRSPRRTPIATSSSPTATARRCCSRTSPRSSTAWRTPRSAAGTRASRRS